MGRITARDFMGPKAKEKELRELLELPDRTLRVLGESRDELITELEEFNYKDAALERMFRPRCIIPPENDYMDTSLPD
jgi:hypothetical protein